MLFAKLNWRNQFTKCVRITSNSLMMMKKKLFSLGFWWQCVRCDFMTSVLKIGIDKNCMARE